MNFPPSPATVHTLPSGLTVIIDDTVDDPVVSCQVWVETGSMHEFPRLGSGVSHLLEHMLFKGTEKYTSATLGETVQAAGGRWNAYTTFDRTVYYIDGPSESTDTYLDVLCEMVFRPAFPQDEFERERDVIRREIDMGKDSPDSQGSRLLFSTIYQRDARRHPVIGHLELFNALTYEDMVSYHSSRYAPANVYIVIAGKVDSAAVLAQLESSTPTEVTRYDDQPIIPTEPRQMGQRIRRKTFAVPVSTLTLAWQAPELSHPDAPALDLLAAVLGAGRSSILYRQIREERDLCLHIGASSWLPPQGPGAFTISAEVAPEGRDHLQQEILSTLAKALKDLSQDDLEKARRMMLTSQFRSLVTASGRASDLGSNWHEARNIDFTRDYLASLESLSIADLRAAANRWIVPHSLTITSLDPQTEATDTAPDILVRKSANTTLTTHTLPNGLTVVLGADQRLPFINLATASLAGAPSETLASHGTASLLSSLLDKGTPTTNAETFAKQLDAHGARFGASSGNNSFTTSSEFLTADAPLITGLISDALANASLPADPLSREKKALAAYIEENRTKPLQEAFRLAREQVFGTHGYGLGMNGSLEALPAITPESLQTYQAKHLAASNSVLAAFGNFQPDAFLDQLDATFGTLATGERFTPPASVTTSGGNHTLTLDKEQAALVISLPTKGLVEESTTALEILQSYTSDMSGPLFVRIREELGLAYSVGSSLWHGIDAGIFSFYLATSPDQLDLAQGELMKQIEQLVKGISADAFAAARTSQIASVALSNQANATKARLASVDAMLGFAPDRFLKQSEVIASTTHAETNAVAAHILSQEPTISRVTPST